ncbi:MAG: OmpH family outer membrane protein [Candidatus Omnitrophica bacterium]|nr:OmpH family outer membrane protein [Candidatus Omnitrophota bacterium]
MSNCGIRKYFLPLILIAVFMVSFSRFSSAAPKEKIATVDIGKIFDEYEKTKKHDQEFQTEGRLKQEERDAIVHEIRRLRDEQALLSEDAKRDKQGAIDTKMKELDSFDEEVRKTLGEKRNQAVREVFQDIENVMTQYGERKGYDLIFNDRALLYKSKEFDVTNDILTELNNNYKKGKKR